MTTKLTPQTWKAVFTLTVLSAATLVTPTGMAAGPILEVVAFDVSLTAKPDSSAPYLASWTATSPDGVKLSANRLHLLRDGQPMPVTMGEMHPQRVPVAEWEKDILKMKAGGLNGISCYWFWTFIEPKPRQFDFTGQNNIRLFLELCKKHDVLVFARIGPFCNAEILCGGLPPWIFGMPYKERSNDPGYLAAVGRYYNEMGRQMRGLLWKEGGPVFMLQLENELSLAPNSWGQVYRQGAPEENRGPMDADGFNKHYQNLYDLAVKAGISVPFYSITGWGMPTGAQPKDHFVYGYGGYMYLGPPGKNNSDLTTLQNAPYMAGRYPVAYVELGAAGSPPRQHWVPMPPVESAISTAFSRIGVSNTLICGWYMYQGGTDPLHPVWGWSTKGDDLALMSYDFHAPLSEYGLRRPAYYQLRPFHQTLLNFGSTFASGAIVCQNPAIKPNDDKLRASVRMGDQDGGVVFLLNYGNINPLSDRLAHLDLKTSSGAVRLPAAGEIEFKNGDAIILPFNMALANGVKLVSSTAQFSSRVTKGDDTVYFSSTLHDQPAQLLFKLPAGVKVKTSGKVETMGDKTLVTLTPTLDAAVIIEGAEGKRSIVAVLPVEAVRHSVEANLNGQKTYLISDQDIVANGNTVRITSKQTNKFSLFSYPAVTWKGGKPIGQPGLFSKVEAEVPPKKIAVNLLAVDSQKALLTMPADAFDGLSDIYAKVDFEGYICRIFDQETGLPVGDQFYDKDWTWWVSLKRFSKALEGKGLVFCATGEAGKMKNKMSAGGMTIDSERVGGGAGKFSGITFYPEYQVTLEAKR